MTCRDSYDSVDDYVESIANFAKPICEELRKIIKKAVPKVDEVIRWGAPCYLYNGLLCSMGAFKNHVKLTFFRGGELKSLENLLGKGGGKNLRMLKFSLMEDIHVKPLQKIILAAAKLNESGPLPKKAPTTDISVVIPGELQQSLALHLKARQNFDSFSPESRREYAEWVAGARTPRSRLQRSEKAAALLEKGKRLRPRRTLIKSKL